MAPRLRIGALAGLWVLACAVVLMHSALQYINLGRAPGRTLPQSSREGLSGTREQNGVTPSLVSRQSQGDSSKERNTSSVLHSAAMSAGFVACAFAISAAIPATALAADQQADIATSKKNSMNALDNSQKKNQPATLESPFGSNKMPWDNIGKQAAPWENKNPLDSLTGANKLPWEKSPIDKLTGQNRLPWEKKPLDEFVEAVQDTFNPPARLPFQAASMNPVAVLNGANRMPWERTPAEEANNFWVESVVPTAAVGSTIGIVHLLNTSGKKGKE